MSQHNNDAKEISEMDAPIQSITTKPILTGPNLILRPITAADAPDMFASLSDKESNRLTGTQDTFTLEQVEKYCAKIGPDPNRADYAITRHNDPTYLGEVVLNEIDWDNRSANFRIALASAKLFGQGLGSEATRLILDYGFTQLNLHRIELEVYDFNPRAQHVYEKIGFVREGVRRDVLFWEGKYQSGIIMSLLGHEYLSR